MTAPSGMMSLKTFQEILTDVTSLSHGTEQLPEAWLNLSPEKVCDYFFALLIWPVYLDTDMKHCI